MCIKIKYRHQLSACLLFLIAHFIFLKAIAQSDKIAFHKLGVEEGLPSAGVIDIIQDDQGFIWISTFNGLVKYDGYDLKAYRPGLNDSAQIQIRSYTGGMAKSNDGRLWMMAGRPSNLITIYDPRDESYENIYIRNDHDFIPTFLWEDALDHVWFIKYFIDSDSKTNELCYINAETYTIHCAAYESAPVSVSISNSLFATLFLTAENLLLTESIKDSSIWIIDKNFNALKWNQEFDKLEVRIVAGSVLSKEIGSDTIRTISSDSTGLLCLTGNQGFYLYDPIGEEIKDSFDLRARSGLKSGSIFNTSFYFNKNYWVLHDKVISILDPAMNEIKSLQIEKEELGIDPDILASNIFLIPHLIEENEVWIYLIGSDMRGKGHLRLDADLKEIKYFDTRFNDQLNFEISGSRVKMVADRTGLKWIGTGRNFYRESTKLRQIDHYTTGNSELPSDRVEFLMEDSHNRVWIGTNRGAAILTRENNLQEVSFQNISNPSPVIIKIIEDSHKQILAIGRNTLFRFSEIDLNFKPVFSTRESSQQIHNIVEDHSGLLWISIQDFGLIGIDPVSGDIIKEYEITPNSTHGLLGSDNRYMHVDHNGNIWLGGNGRNIGVHLYDTKKEAFKYFSFTENDKTSLSDNRITFFGDDQLGRVWIGTIGRGLNIYNEKTGAFKRVKDNYDLSSPAGYAKTKNQSMWISTNSGGGLALVDPVKDSIIFYGEEKGLLHNDVLINLGDKNIPIDQKGRIWLPNNRGLSVFDTASRTYQNFFEYDGFQPHSGFYSVLVRSNGEVWIGGDQGLNLIDPERLFRKDTIPPKVWITEMGIMDSIYSKPDGEIFHKSVSYTDHIELDHWQKDLQFEFVALHYLRPEDNQYSWKLENYDRQWSAPSTTRNASYTNLSPGTYTFRVKGSNADGIWNDEGDFITIRINPPFWLTTWAYGFYSLVFLAGIYTVHRLQKERTIRKERERTREKELAQAKEIKKAYSELEVAHSNLKSAQSQLIQTEKMASLGELTAGIAHEIQNPLNFVNNFSEVNAELVEELKEEVEKGNIEEVKAIARDILENESKIKHHGKRAESIVKGMLQHSRTSTGEKEPTDINAIADEYLRLAYHGLRAKDKSFNAEFKTDFDPNLPKINVVPQDIGRVLLNLINNAFYAVHEKAARHSDPEHSEGVESGAASNNYKPEVVVSTQQLNGKIEICVKDNGPGIPEQVRDKIFQPFFTTKPTGQGTGLGLSLSYDIVKAHGGELKVESEIGKGSEFVISLPMI